MQKYGYWTLNDTKVRERGVDLNKDATWWKEQISVDGDFDVFQIADGNDSNNANINSINEVEDSDKDKDKGSGNGNAWS